MSRPTTSDTDGPSRFFGDLLQFSPGAAILIDCDGTIVAANTLVDRLLDRSPSDLAGLPVSTLFPERVREIWYGFFLRCLGAPEDWPLGEMLDLLVCQTDLTEVPVTICLRPLPNDSPSHVVVWLQDMTKHRRTEDALRAGERRFRIASHHTADVIQEIDFKTGEMTLSGDIDNLMGFQSGGFPRTLDGWLGIIHSEDRDRVLDDFNHFVESGAETWRFEYRVCASDGSYRHWVDHGTVTEFGEDGRILKGVGAAQDITERVVHEQELRRALAELEDAKARLSSENIYLQEEIREGLDYGDIVGDSENFRRVLTQVKLVAELDATVLVHGETGTGKELVARALQALSKRNDHPLIKVNCAALPSTLIESELFGHEKGAFSGAVARRTGRFELADRGTLLLDEVSEIPLELQVKLLQVLQDGEFERLGSSRTMKTDVRIIALTNRDLQRAVNEGRFRADLYYRLAVFPIEVPPLRERPSDIRPLCFYFLSRYNAKHGKSVDEIPKNTMEALEAYDWPGNVRELENLIERGLILSPGTTLRIDATALNRFSATDPAPIAGSTSRTERRAEPLGTETLEDIERAHIVSTLETCDWKVKGRGNAAERLGLNEATLRSRMKRYGIQRPR